MFTNDHDLDQWVDSNQDIKYHNPDHGKGPLENEFNDNSHQVGWLKAGDQTILALHKRVITHNTRYLGNCGNLVFANIDPLVGQGQCWSGMKLFIFSNLILMGNIQGLCEPRGQQGEK